MSAPGRLPNRTSRLAIPRTIAVALLVMAVGFGWAVAFPPGARAAQPAAPADVFVNMSATTSFSFVPNSFTVLPGSHVQVDITQMANFEHTFTVSPLVNATIPSSDTPSELASFFNAHPPVVNVSLGSTPGIVIVVTFIAPATLGTYEFLCLIHFPTMTGVMTVASSLPSPSNSSGVSPLEIAGIGAVAAVAVIAGVAYGVTRARRRSRAPMPPPPPDTK